MEKLCSLCGCKILNPTSLNGCDEIHKTLSIFFSCFNYDFRPDLTRSDYSSEFVCLRCKSFLREWQEMEIQISQLQLKSRHYRASLISRILCGHKIPLASEFEKFSSSGSGKVAHHSVWREIHEVIRNLLNGNLSS